MKNKKIIKVDITQMNNDKNIFIEKINDFHLI